MANFCQLPYLAFKQIPNSRAVDQDRNRRFESVYSKRVRAGKRRTYFFDVRQTKGDDYYITMTESTKRFDGNGHERHKIFLYKEDFNRFLSGLQETIDHVKNDLMPDYDYDEFDRRQAEFEARIAAEREAEANGTSFPPNQESNTTPDVIDSSDIETEDDISW